MYYISDTGATAMSKFSVVQLVPLGVLLLHEALCYDSLTVTAVLNTI